MASGRLVELVVMGAPLTAPVVAGVVARARREPSRAAAWVTVAAAAAILVSGVWAATLTVDGSSFTAGSVLRVDALSAVMLVVIGSVGVIATWASVTFMDSELASGEATGPEVRRYATLVPAFLAAMVLAVLANNLGVLWAAVEATTIVTAFLVGHRRSRGSVEATWKYVIICSVGIALAYLGTILVYYAARQTSIPEHEALDWSQLAAHAHELDPGVMRIAFALLLLGFGAKAGMIPLHSWLPDAHSQAPAPVSALMSGVLLPVAVYALIRYRVIAVGALDPDFVRSLLLVVGLGSLALATSLIIAQRDYKRLLAYSSIEHMGLIVIGLAIGTPLAIAAGLLHILGHGLGKAVLFCGAGQVLICEGTSRIAGVRGLLARQPVLAGTFGLGFLALLGLPPFSLFVSELGLARAAADAGLGWVIGAALAMLVVVFVAIAAHLGPMILGSGSGSGSGATGRVAGVAAASGTAPLVVGLLVLAVLGVVAWPVDQVLDAASLIGGTP
ncbi:proton-conducting transporter transmembrane domain-containing protein [Nocardioides dilutus]